MTKTSSNKLTALVVDDEKDMLLIYTKALESQNYAVECAENGSEADFKLNRNIYNIIITDINMPYMDGVTFVKNVRNSLTNNKAPIIVVSGYLSKQNIINLAKHGVAKIFSKPVNLKELIEFINKTLNYAGDPARLKTLEQKKSEEEKKEEPDEIEVA